MMELHENIDEALLLLYFSGTLGEKEKEEVENWISLSEENRKIAKQICYIHHVTDIIDTVKQIDPKQALVKLDKRLSKRKKINWWRFRNLTDSDIRLGLIYLQIQNMYLNAK